MYFRIAEWLKAITFIIVIVAIYLFVSAVSTTVVLFILASFLTFILGPIVDFLTSRDVNRTAAIILTYLLILALLAAVIFLFGPFLIDQLTVFLREIPRLIQVLQTFADEFRDYAARIISPRDLSFNLEPLVNEISRLVAAQLRNLVALIPSFFALVANIVIVFFLSIYLLYYLPRIDRAIKESLSNGLKIVYDRFLRTMRGSLGRYLFGVLILMISVGILSGIAVWLLGLPFPIVLGVWAGLTEIIPIFGPILGAIPAVLIAFTIRPILALWVIIAFIIVQQFESNILTPFVFKGSAGLNPLLVVLAIIAGAEIAGVIGIFLAVPVLVAFITIAGFIRDNFTYVRVEDGLDKVWVKKK